MAKKNDIVNHNATVKDSLTTATGEIVLYQPDETIRLEVRMENDTVWINRQQMALLFGRDVKTIGKHINNALKEELRKTPTVAKFAIVQTEGNRRVVRTIEFYNLDMVISAAAQRSVCTNRHTELQPCPRPLSAHRRRGILYRSLA